MTDDLAPELERYDAERNAAVKAGMTLEEFDALHAEPPTLTDALRDIASTRIADWRHIEVETDPLGDTITREVTALRESIVLECIEGDE